MNDKELYNDTVLNFDHFNSSISVLIVLVHGELIFSLISVPTDLLWFYPLSIKKSQEIRYTMTQFLVSDKSFSILAYGSSAAMVSIVDFQSLHDSGYSGFQLLVGEFAARLSSATSFFIFQFWFTN